jgi:hypothetical protein
MTSDKQKYDGLHEPLSVTIFTKKAKVFLNWVQKLSPCKGQSFLRPLSNFI